MEKLSPIIEKKLLVIADRKIGTDNGNRCPELQNYLACLVFTELIRCWFQCIVIGVHLDGD